MSEQKQTLKLPNSFIIAGTTHISIGGGYLLLSTITAKHLAYNTYMGLLLGLLFFLPFIFIIADLARLFPHQSFTTIFRLVLGKYGGAFLSLLFIFHVIITSALGLKQSQLMVSNYFFSRTPQLLVNFIFIGIVLYLTLHGIKAVSRLGAFMLIPPVIIIFVLISLGLINTNWLNLRPIVTGAPVQWLKAGFDSLYALIPATSFVFYLPFIKIPKQIPKIALISLGISFPLFFLATLGMIGTFGPSVINKIAWPTVEFFHVIDLPFLLLEQAGLFFLITWYAFIFLAESFSIFLTSNEIHYLLPKFNLKWITFVISIIYLIIASLPLDIVIQTYLTSKFYWLFIIMDYAPFLITWLVARIRFPKTKKII